ncbi:MAG: hypothetical protein P8M07_05360, partial [Flavobacteriales bacterium]|nr:hypothetical protein [Flavobacteriales bacterium]
MKNQTRSFLAFALFAVVIISSSFTPSPYQEGTIVSFPTEGLSDITPLDSDEADWNDEVTLVWELVTLAPDQVPESGAATHRVYAQLNSPSHSMIAVFGTQESPISISTTTSFFQHEFGGNMATDINPALYEIEPDLASDSWVTLGSEPSSDDPNLLYSAGLDWSSFGAGASLTSDPSFGGAWFVLPSESIVTPDSQGRVLLAQLTST